MISKASDLLLIKRQTSHGLALELPESVEAMHADVGNGAIEEFVILPAYPSTPQLPDQEPKTRKILAWVLVALLIALVLGAFATDLFGGRS